MLLDALSELPPYTGETFLGVRSVDRRLFLVGAKVSWPVFVSGSTLWRTALENTPDFEAKAKKGTVFILKSRSGRHVGQYSQFSFDSEVVFAPFTRWQVTNWYHGDVICLGQANIREHTFGVKSEASHFRKGRDEMLNSDQSLIIELQEV